MDSSNGLYYLAETTSETLSAENSSDADIWLRRMGHLSFSGLSCLSKSQHSDGLPNIDISSQICANCLAGKHYRERFPKKSETRVKHPGIRIHTDVMGRMPQQSLGGSRFILVFTDDHSRKSWCVLWNTRVRISITFVTAKLKLKQRLGIVCAS